ncbi:MULTISPECIES: PssE/Cps14G family polysaccharide biosynthesis glycosyltransferase [Salinivibrio]|uniref:PssE/Cps14G family polysaccharide biosynthesis glycosyltransferase n=1 Tax=Salinivibrio TaxID=51366 RepID=UPI0009899DE3|nr:MULTISPECIES: PssE/Cps14G family polysaccharide biosynthesis glycosyltransferase [Salinivibrio]OOF13810.1 hypothetical protein BZG84_15295 [Salinivibrio sp. PR932]OOF31709.1 hypothetical protein BZJ20_03920 [Salinivibrio proteolyticus]
MKILVTVGTTAFDELIAEIDQSFEQDSNVSIIAQVSEESCYNTHNIRAFSFCDNLQPYIEQADVVVTHAGAGSVYSMLESSKKLVVVPNLQRADKHQLELAKYVHENKFAIACLDLKTLKHCIFQAVSMDFSPYHREKFFGHSIIRNLLT